MEKKAIKDYYTENSQNEWKRLATDPFHSLEFEVTLRFLKKYLPKKGLILDAGGGPGRYTIELAKLGYEMVLLDLTPELLRIAKRKIKKAGIENKVKLVVEGSIVDLSRFKDDYFDGVICLGGPLSHVSGGDNRNRAVKELVRVAKKSAPIFISVMGRLAVVMATPHYWPVHMNTPELFKDMWKYGEDNMWCGNSYCHFFMPEELEEIVSINGVEIIERVGLEGLGSPFWKDINKMARGKPETYKNWLEMHNCLCTHPGVFATSGHMLIIGKKI